MSGRVFISHSSFDALAARQVCSALEKSGIPCWMAPRDIPSGANWPATLAEGLDQAVGIVFLYSSASAASEEVKSELVIARRKRLPLLPIRLEPIMPQGEMAFFLASAQWIDATTAPLESLLPEVCAAMRRALSGKIPAKTGQPSPSNHPKFIRDFRGHSEPVESVAFAEEGRLIVSTAWDLTVRLWDPQSGRSSAVLRGHEGSPTHPGTVYAAVPLGDGRRLASAGSDGTIRVWDLPGGGTGRKIATGQGAIHALCAIPRSERVLAAGADGTVLEWNCSTLRQVATLTKHKGIARCVACDAEGQTAVSGGDDRVIHLLDLASGSEVATTSLQSVALTAALDPRDRAPLVRQTAEPFPDQEGRVLLGTADGKLVLLSLPGLKPLGEIKAHGDAVRGVAFLDDGRAVSAGRDAALKLWDLSSGLCEWTDTDYKAPINGLAAQGGSIVVGSADGVLRLYRL